MQTEVQVPDGRPQDDDRQEVDNDGLVGIVDGLFDGRLGVLGLPQLTDDLQVAVAGAQDGLNVGMVAEDGRGHLGFGQLDRPVEALMLW